MRCPWSWGAPPSGGRACRARRASSRGSWACGRASCGVVVEAVRWASTPLIIADTCTVIMQTETTVRRFEGCCSLTGGSICGKTTVQNGVLFVVGRGAQFVPTGVPTHPGPAPADKSRRQTKSNKERQMARRGGAHTCHFTHNTSNTMVVNIYALQLLALNASLVVLLLLLAV